MVLCSEALKFVEVFFVPGTSQSAEGSDLFIFGIDQDDEQACKSKGYTGVQR